MCVEIIFQQSYIMGQVKSFFINRDNKLTMLRISFGIIYFWFGILKYFPHTSPAESLAENTIYDLVLGFMPKHTCLILLAIMETSLGLMFITGKFIKTAIIIAIFHMVCTFTPFFFFSELSFTKPPVVLTLVGQYIMKNIVFICALWLLWPVENQIDVVTSTKSKKIVYKEHV